MFVLACGSRQRVDNGREGKAVRSRLGCRSRKSTDHIFVCIPEVESGNMEV